MSLNLKITKGALFVTSPQEKDVNNPIFNEV
jgi:hypothetical protein